MREAEYSPLASRVNLAMAEADMEEGATGAIKDISAVVAQAMRMVCSPPEPDSDARDLRFIFVEADRSGLCQAGATIRNDLLTIAENACACLIFVKVRLG